MIIFTKYSNDRRPELAIRTDIIEDGGVKSVIKAAADPRASAHISGLMDSYQGLRRMKKRASFLTGALQGRDSALLSSLRERCLRNIWICFSTARTSW